MSEEAIIIIAPELTPGAGGVADYTLRVVAEWGGRGRVRFLVPEGAPAAEVLAKNSRALRKQLPARGGKVLLQYSAYGFNRFGYPRSLLRGLADWRKKSGGRLVLMLHEIWAFWPFLNQNYFMQHLHRRDLRRLVQAADATFTSTASQAAHLRRLVPAAEIQVLPVGSNIRPVRLLDSMRQPGVAVLFGLAASRRRVRQKMERALAALVAAQRLTKVVEVGGEGMDEAEISALLAQAQFGISAQDELSVTKSGTFMAYAAHGLNILSPFAGPAQPPPLCWATHPDELQRGVPDQELSARAEKLRAWQEHSCSWPQIAAQFARALQSSAPAPVA